MKILTLCDKCRQLLSESYSVRPYNMAHTTTQPQKKCEQCHKQYRVMRMYIIGKKGWE